MFKSKTPKVVETPDNIVEVSIPELTFWIDKESGNLTCATCGKINANVWTKSFAAQCIRFHSYNVHVAMVDGSQIPQLGVEEAR